MPRRLYEIGGKSFSSKEGIANYVRLIIERTPDGECVTDGFDWLCELAKHHTHAIIKIGSGIRAFRVGVNAVWGKHKVLTLIRTDRTETDFSWRECIWPTSHVQRVKNACRAAVADQVSTFARVSLSKGNVWCPVSGDLLSFEYHHVDHYVPTFNSLVESWLQSEGVKPEDLEVAGLEDGEMRDRFAVPAYAASFSEYHAKHASLRLLSPTANMRRKQ